MDEKFDKLKILNKALLKATSKIRIVQNIKLKTNKENNEDSDDDENFIINIQN